MYAIKMSKITPKTIERTLHASRDGTSLIRDDHRFERQTLAIIRFQRAGKTQLRISRSHTESRYSLINVPAKDEGPGRDMGSFQQQHDHQMRIRSRPVCAIGMGL